MQTPDTYCAECAFDREEGPCLCDSHRDGYHDGNPCEGCHLCVETCSQCNSTTSLRRSPLGDLHCVACIRRDGVNPETWEDADPTRDHSTCSAEHHTIGAESYEIGTINGSIYCHELNSDTFGPFDSIADARELLWNTADESR